MIPYGKLLSSDLGRSLEELRYSAYSLSTSLVATIVRPPQLAAANLQVLIDGSSSEDDLEALVQMLVEASVPMMQLRDKKLADRELLERAHLVHGYTCGKALFVMNDRPDLAVLARADGVHVGQEELEVGDVRRIVGASMLIGVSTHNIEQARQAVRDGADYIGCGPTFPSNTKSFGEFPGLEFLKQVSAEIRIPAFAIGGITLENLSSVLETGMSRVAISGAITGAGDPGEAARQFISRLPVPPAPSE